ncbi:hypothetical protein [Cylindrospermopsis raciborskii]|nr:hypothetical protein [Cylindrospermopsis raciborskii]
MYCNFELGSREQDGRSRVGSTVRSPKLINNTLAKKGYEKVGPNLQKA